MAFLRYLCAFVLHLHDDTVVFACICGVCTAFCYYHQAWYLYCIHFGVAWCCDYICIVFVLRVYVFEQSMIPRYLHGICKVLVLYLYCACMVPMWYLYDFSAYLNRICVAIAYAHPCISAEIVLHVYCVCVVFVWYSHCICVFALCLYVLV